MPLPCRVEEHPPGEKAMHDFENGAGQSLAGCAALLHGCAARSSHCCSFSRHPVSNLPASCCSVQLPAGAAPAQAQHPGHVGSSSGRRRRGCRSRQPRRRRSAAQRRRQRWPRQGGAPGRRYRPRRPQARIARTRIDRAQGRAQGRQGGTVSGRTAEGRWGGWRSGGPGRDAACWWTPHAAAAVHATRRRLCNPAWLQL